MIVLSTPEDEERYAVLGDAIWKQTISFCIKNIDSTLLKTGLNRNKNMFYGDFINNSVKPPLPITEQLVEIFLNKTKTLFIRSRDLPSSKSLDFFMVLLCFVPFETSYVRGSYSMRALGGHPIISVYVRCDIGNTDFSSEFIRLKSSNDSNTFIHEFTHYLDDKKYDLLKNVKFRAEDTSTIDYVNFNHEIDARYIEFIHNILVNLVKYRIRGKYMTIAKSFPNFKYFYSYYWNEKFVPYYLIKYISPDNKKRLIRRLFKFYQYLIEEQMKNTLKPQENPFVLIKPSNVISNKTIVDIDMKKAITYAKDQVLED